MTNGNSSDFHCSELSLKADENLFGTAPNVDVWFLLEYPERWTGTAFKSSDIPEDVKQFLFEHLKSIPNSRIQLIKNENSSGDSIKFYIAVSDEAEPGLFEFTLPSYQDILSMDINKSLSGDPSPDKDPVFLVCTNEEYDACCGKIGEEVYTEASKNENGHKIWRTTHVGGHRFAANLVCLPYGVYYGRVRESNFGSLIEAYKSRKLILKNYRGRSCYTKDAQSGEYFLRKKTGITEISAFRLVEHRSEGRNLTFQFLSEADGKKHEVQIEKDEKALKNFTTCGDKRKSDITQYRLVGYKKF